MTENIIRIICIGCPLGCEVSLTLGDKEKVCRIQGNSCKEGKDYALEEYRNPARVLTTALRTKDSNRPLLPVKTTKAVLKTHLAQCMSALSKVKVAPPIKIGEVIIANLIGTGADVIATDDLR